MSSCVNISRDNWLYFLFYFGRGFRLFIKSPRELVLKEVFIHINFLVV